MNCQQYEICKIKNFDSCKDKLKMTQIIRKEMGIQQKFYFQYLQMGPFVKKKQKAVHSDKEDRLQVIAYLQKIGFSYEENNNNIPTKMQFKTKVIFYVE